MKKETKNAIYSLLDLIDSLGTIDFITFDLEKVNSIRKELLNVIEDKNNESKNNDILDSNGQELLGVLPTILLDNDKFTSVKDILVFAEKCLGIEIKEYWIKRSKAEVIGIIIAEVAKQSPNQRNKFLRKWDSFQNHSKRSNGQMINTSNNKDFTDIWFNFFDTYKENI